MTARILLCRRMGEPLVFLDLSFLRVVSARECLVKLLVGVVEGRERRMGTDEVWKKWSGSVERDMVGLVSAGVLGVLIRKQGLMRPVFTVVSSASESI